MIHAIQNDHGVSELQPGTLMAEYQKVLAHSDLMVRKAQEGDWDSLVSEGLDYLVRADELSSLGDTQLNFSQRRERQVYLQRLLDNDRKISEQLDGRLKELSLLMADEVKHQHSHQVSNAYQRFSGS